MSRDGTAVSRTPSFTLGQIVATPGALQALLEANQDPEEFLLRHARGDWGIVCKSDWRANSRALKDSSRLLSAYELSSGEKLWIITEADRSSTTLLLPEDY